MMGMVPLEIEVEYIDKIYEKNKIKYDWSMWYETEPDINSYHIWKAQYGSGSKSSAITRYVGSDEFKLVNNKISIEGLKPLDVQQTCLFDSLMDDSIRLVTVTGCAGSGKTMCSMTYAISQVIKNNDLKLMCMKPTEIVVASKFFGAVPGDNSEKLMPFLDSFFIAGKKAIADQTYFKLLQEKGRIQFKPIEFCRGDTYDNTILILDESQNLQFHPLKTVLTRLGENSKAIVLGDITQKDVRRNEKSGFELLKSAPSFKNSYITANIHLENDYRSNISRLVSQIDTEVWDD